MTVKTRIQIRRGNLADLPTLEAGEPGFTLDTHDLYIGDGSSNWLISGGSSSGGSAGGASGDMLKSAYDSDDDGSVELADAILGASAAGSSKYYGTDASAVAGFYDLPSGGASSSAANHYPCLGRLTALSNSPVPAADVLAASEVYFTPYCGDTIALYDGSNWNERSFAEVSIKLTQTLTPIVTSGSKVLVDLEDTSQLTVGMEISGTGIAASSVITSIDSASQVTMNNNATLNGHYNVTFKIPANRNVDVYAWDDAGALKLAFGELWSSDAARFASGTYAANLPTLNGVAVKSSNGTDQDPTRRYLGTLRSTAVAGECEDSKYNRFVWNFYNQVRRYGDVVNTTASSYTRTASSATQWNNGTNQKNFACVLGLPAMLLVVLSSYCSSNGTTNIWLADSASTNIVTNSISGATAVLRSAVGVFMGAIGYHTIIGYELYNTITHYTGVGNTWGAVEVMA